MKIITLLLMLMMLQGCLGLMIAGTAISAGWSYHQNERIAETEEKIKELEKK